MKIAYVRVSTIEQNEERQIEGLKKHGIDKWYTEKVSGKNTDRIELKKCWMICRKGIQSMCMIFQGLLAVRRICWISWSC